MGAYGPNGGIPGRVTERERAHWCGDESQKTGGLQRSKEEITNKQIKKTQRECSLYSALAVCKSFWTTEGIGGCVCVFVCMFVKMLRAVSTGTRP